MKGFEFGQLGLIKDNDSLDSEVMAIPLALKNLSLIA